MAKVFQIFVPDNTLVSRIISCETQVTELYVIDRADKKFFADYASELNKPALYILVNRDKKQLYVGETDDSVKRLRNHESKDFWTEAIVFHSTIDTLSTTEVKWLEAKTYEALKELGYYDLSENKQVPQQPPLKRNQIYTLEPIFEEAKNYICAAGFDIFFRHKEVKQQAIEFPEPEKESETVEQPKEDLPSIWLLSSNKKQFNLKSCFDKYGQVHWQQKGVFCAAKAGDKGYIYSANPDQSIKYSFEIVESGQPYAKDMDREDEFVSGKGKKNSEFGSEGGGFATVKMTGMTEGSSLTLTRLLNNGLNGAPQGPICISKDKFKEIREYIEAHFDDKGNPDQKSARRAPFRFSMIGLKVGDVVTFAPRNIQVKVASDRTIKYNGEQYALSRFCKIFMPSENSEDKEYQGPAHFMLNGKTLDDIRKEKEGGKPKAKSASNSRSLQLDFWMRFRDKLKSTGKIASLQTPQPHYWYDVRIGRSNIMLSDVCNTQKNFVGVKLYIRNKVADVYYPALEARRNKINLALGCEPVWDANPLAKDKTIALYHQTELTDPVKMEKALDWLVEQTIIFYRVFSEEVKEISHPK